MDVVSEDDRRADYEFSLEEEKQRYEDCVEVHDLPEIFHYWSNRHLRLKLQPFRLDSPNCAFRKYLEAKFEDYKPGQRHFVSLGAGNCDLEINVALHLRGLGRANFLIDCVDLNSAMLERGRIAAANAGVEDRLRFLEGDLNAWDPAVEYDAAFANQSLHHVVNLERLFAEVKRALHPDGVFIISDMIGRNGHQRWPEALEFVYEFWRLLPPSYRFNCQLGCHEEIFENRDCSRQGFEGVRSQDILPLLVSQFQFHLFIPFGNVIDPFIDRAFGPNFDAGAKWDRAFIDQVNDRDEREILGGELNPLI